MSMSTSISDLPGPSEEEIRQIRPASPIVHKKKEEPKDPDYFTADNEEIDTHVQNDPTIDYLVSDDFENFTVTKQDKPTTTSLAPNASSTSTFLDQFTNEINQENIVVFMFIVLAALPHTDQIIRKLLATFKLTQITPMVSIFIKCILLLIIFICVKITFLSS